MDLLQIALLSTPRLISSKWHLNTGLLYWAPTNTHLGATKNFGSCGSSIVGFFFQNFHAFITSCLWRRNMRKWAQKRGSWVPKLAFWVPNVIVATQGTKVVDSSYVSFCVPQNIALTGRLDNLGIRIADNVLRQIYDEWQSSEIEV